MALIRFLVSALTLAKIAVAQDVQLSPTATVPQGASQFVDHRFPCFAMQVSSFEDYIGTNGQPNQFTQNLLDAIANRTGSACVMRMGGTNADDSSFDPSLNIAVNFPDPIPSKPDLDAMRIGPPLFTSLPLIKDIQWVFPVPLERDNMSLTVLWTSLAVKNLGADRILAIELGNEPDLYPAVRRPQWSPSDYVSQWSQYANAIIEQVELPDKQIFQGPDLSSAGHDGFTIQSVWEAGFNKDNLIKLAASHHYQACHPVGANVPKFLLNHTWIAAGLDTFVPSIQYLEQQQPGMPYVLSETGRYPGKGFKTSAPELGNFAGALWTADMMLYAMTLNVSRINMEIGSVLGFSAFIPQNNRGLLNPGVQAIYYAHLFVADVLGLSPNIQVSMLPASSDTFAAYAVYDKGALAKVALINLESHLPSDSQRPTKNINIALPQGVSGLSMQSLQAPDIEEIYNVTWGGEQYSFPSGTSSKTTGGTGTAEINNGAASITIPAAEAMLVTLQYKNGQEPSGNGGVGTAGNNPSYPPASAPSPSPSHAAASQVGMVPRNTFGMLATICALFGLL